MTTEQTPVDRRTTLDLLIQGVHALRLDVRSLSERIAEQSAALDAIQAQNAAILEAVQHLTDAVLEQRARCTTMHPPDRELRAVL
ncbi:MAG: hypothetical protein ACRC4O_07095 [Giesbergeria sp.]